MSKKFQEQVEDFKRGLLDAVVAQLNSEQLGFFLKLFPSGVPEDRIEIAYDLCERTLHKKTGPKNIEAAK